MRQSENPDFIEALARGLDVIHALGGQSSVSLAEIAKLTGLARPTARRILITLQELGYVRNDSGAFALTPRVLSLSRSYTSSMGIWEVARPYLSDLAREINESCSIAQLDGSDVVYVARVAVPKLVGLSVGVGTRFPAYSTSLGKVLLAALTPEDLATALATPSLADVDPTWHPDPEELEATLREVRARGWAITDQQLAPAIRSVAAPIRNGDGRVIAAVNVNAHAMETSTETLKDDYLPRLLRTASAIGEAWALWDARPESVVTPADRR